MKTDLLSQYAAIREELEKEKTQIEQKLLAINEALGGATVSLSHGSLPSRTRGRRGGAPGGQSLKTVVLQVLRNGPLHKGEILTAVQREGYTFTSKNPANSLGVILYGKKPKFNRAHGKFGLPLGFKSEVRETADGGQDKRKRQMSAAGRKRIAEAAKKRWAAVKAAGKTRL